MGLTAAVQVIRVASKPPVVQSFVAVADQASQPRPQPAVPESAVQAQTKFSQVSVHGLCGLQPHRGR